jgi:flavin-dependent dehydrogenase
MERSVKGAAVIVVGGGPAGASTAFALARNGIDVLVLDRARFPRDKPCSEYLSPQASRILADMGALHLVEAAGAAELEGMIVRAPNGMRIHGRYDAVRNYRPFRDRGLAIRRTLLDAILLDRAREAGARVVEATRVLDVVRDHAGRVTGVRTQDAEGIVHELTAGCVIGADGLRSVVARRLSLSRVRRWPHRIAIVTHFRGVDGMGACGEMHVERGGYFGLANVGLDLTNVAVVVPAARARDMHGDPAAFLQSWIDRLPHVAPRFRRAERVTEARATGPFASAARRGWAPGAALVGDAADFFDPFTGEGMYAALRGGELLAPYVYEVLRARTTRDADDALEAYDRSRRHEFGGKWNVERLIGSAVASPLLMNLAARSLARQQDMADLLVGVTGDFVPASAVLRFGYVARLVAGAFGPAVPGNASGDARVRATSVIDDHPDSRIPTPDVP